MFKKNIASTTVSKADNLYSNETDVGLLTYACS
jgi:hypothetical protein